MRLARVEHFADCAQAVLIHPLGKTLEKFSRGGVFARMDFEPRVDERPDEPGPHSSLVIRTVARTQIAGVNRFVIRMLRRERTQADRREQLFLGYIYDGSPPRLVENRMIERDRKQLVRPAGGIIFSAAVHADHIVKIAAFREPKALVETIARAFGVVGITLCARRVASLG